MEYVLMPSEVELYIESMIPQNMLNLGTLQWLDWHQRIQKLNQEALIEASELKEEHVKESLVSYGKAPILVHEAILINIWKYKVLPHLLKLEPQPTSTFMAYSILYHEAVSVSLLELVMFHVNCCETLEDFAADLLDYLSGASAKLLSVKTNFDTEKRESSIEELMRQRENLCFEIGIRSLSIIRYLSESLERLPISVTTRMYNTHDIPMLFVQILMDKPWICDEKQFSGGKWRNIDSEQITQAEAQIWLTLRQLLLDEKCQSNYSITESRKTQLVKLLPVLTPTLLDQLSPLIDLKQWLCRLTVMDQTGGQQKPFLLEAVLEIKEKIIAENGGKWKKIAEKQLPNVFSNDKGVLKHTAQKLSEAYNTELLEKFDVGDKAICAFCNKTALQRCSKCKKSWYCSRKCQVDHWPQHRDDCFAS